MTAMPFTSDAEATAALKNVQLLSREDSADRSGRGFSLKLSLKHPEITVYMNAQRNMIGIKNLRCLLFEAHVRVS
jgi:hypothetical protein